MDRGRRRSIARRPGARPQGGRRGGLGLARSRFTNRPARMSRSGCRRAAAKRFDRSRVRSASRPTSSAGPRTGYDVKRVALARVIVDNVRVDPGGLVAATDPSSRRSRSPSAQTTSTASRRKTTRPEGRRRAPLEEIRRNIRAAGQEPVERNGPVRAHASTTSDVSAAPLMRPRDSGSSGRGRVSERAAAGATVSIGSPRFDLRYDVPSECARLLHAARDRRRPDPVDRVSCAAAVPDRARSGDRVARSRRVGGDLSRPSRSPTSGSIALDTSSRTSVALVSVLCARRFRIHAAPRIARSRSARTCSRRADAALIIGDNALLLNPPPATAARSRRSISATSGRR